MVRDFIQPKLMRIIGLDLNHKIIQTEQSPDGTISVITAGVAESVPLDNKSPEKTPSFVQFSETLQSSF